MKRKTLNLGQYCMLRDSGWTHSGITGILRFNVPLGMAKQYKIMQKNHQAMLDRDKRFAEQWNKTHPTNQEAGE